MDDTLVSIIVITYNSSQYVLETLESVTNQTYQSIELIISDDGSNDETVEICKKWLLQNKERFVHTELLTVSQNTGIPANCNRGLKVANGEWLKFIAGDDALLPNCIATNVDYVLRNNRIDILQTLCDLYSTDFEDKNYLRSDPDTRKRAVFDLECGKQQYDFFVLKGFNPFSAPSMFIKKNLLSKYGGFDERFKLLEDYPFWAKITKDNNKIYLNPISTVKYRVGYKTITKPYMTEHQAIHNIFFIKEFFKEDIETPRVRKILILSKALILFDRMGLNNKSNVSKIFYYLLYKLL